MENDELAPTLYDQRRRRDDDELALTLSRPTKRQKKLLSSANDLLILPTKFCSWLCTKFIRPLLFMPPSTSDLIPFNNNNNNNSSSGASGTDLLRPSKYDVFISFRGPDVRNSFLSHLYSHLNDYKKLAVYKDDVDLERGEQISPALLQAIQVSDVYLVILSPKYTDSPWCLEELEKILQCMKLYGRRVIPVFYGVDPSDVENQKLPTATAGEIRSWRAALSEITNLTGFDSQVIRPETKLIEEITEAVFRAIHRSSQMVKFSSYSASRGLVGVETKMEEVIALLQRRDRSKMTIGLWGMAGVGKTALAKAFFDLFSCQFEASYFFSNFADAIANGFSRPPFGNLQNNFFTKLLGDENGRAGGALSYDLTLNRLGRMKALVVIDDVGDDVGNIGPLKELLNGRYCDLFGSGSLIIMTSRNKQLLKSVCHDVYEVNGLGYGEASRLFRLHAFREETVPSEYLQMLLRAMQYVGGNPLAITVLGAHLFGRDLKFWDRELDALRDNPNPVVESVLRRSYDGLSQVEKDLFLDLACFYDYWSGGKLERIEELEETVVNLITNLADKSLLSITLDGNFEMNRLLRDLGRKIVNEERQIERRSRLWELNDISNLFGENKGTQLLEGIFWSSRDKLCVPCIQADAFAKMENLRILVIRVTFELILPETGLNSLPKTLKILVWHSFASKWLPSQFYAGNLVILDLSRSQIEELWEDDELSVDLGNMKSLLLTECKSLKKLHDLSTAKRLETINLSSCESLVELPTSILDLPKLESLDVGGCSNLKWDNLEECANSSRGQSGRHSDFLSNLTIVDLSKTPIHKVPNFITWLHVLDLRCYQCTELTEFPIVPSLERLTLTGSLIEKVDELEKLTELHSLDLSNNDQLVLISCDFSKLKSLEKIRLDGCSKLSHLPDNIGDLIHLGSLDLSRTALKELPFSIGDLIKLISLELEGCKSLASLPDSIGKLMNLVSIDLSFTAVRELPPSIGDLVRLFELLLVCCKNLESLPDTIHKLPGLSELNLIGCDQLRYLPELPSSLYSLDAHGCKTLQTLSTGFLEKHHFTNADWCFAKCWKLDPAVCSKLVDKFAQDSVQISSFQPKLLLPAKWGSESGGEEGSTMGSNNSNNNNTMVTATLRGQPWMSNSTIFCALLDSHVPLPINQGYSFLVECVMLNHNDNPESNVSSCYWNSHLEQEDPMEEPLSNGHFLIWSASEPIVASSNEDDSSTFKFLFRVKRSDGYELPNFIKDCRVIPVYDDRIVKNEDEEEDDNQSPTYLQGLYDQMCTHR